MRKKDYKGRCEKQMIEKCKTVCKTYDPIQAAYCTIVKRVDTFFKEKYLRTVA